MMFYFLDNFSNEKIQEREQQAIERFKKGEEQINQELSSLESKVLEWNSEISSDTEQEQIIKFEAQRQSINKRYSKLQSDYVTEMHYVDEEKIKNYINHRKAEYDRAKKIEIDIKETLDKISSEDLKEWLSNPMLNRWEFIIGLNLKSNDKGEIKYSDDDSEIERFLVFTTKAFDKIINLFNLKEVAKVLKEEKAYKKEELHDKNFFAINENDNDIGYSRISKIDMSIQKMICSDARKVTEKSMFFISDIKGKKNKEQDKQDFLYGELIKSLIGEEFIKKGLRKIGFSEANIRAFNFILFKSVPIASRINSLEDKPRKTKDFFNDRDNLTVTFSLDEYMRHYGYKVLDRSDEKNARDELTASIMCLKALTLRLTNNVYKEILGIDQDKDLIFGIMTDALVPNEECRNSTYKIFLNENYMKLASSKLCDYGTKVISRKARELNDGENRNKLNRLTEVLLENYVRPNNYNTKGKNGSTKEPNFDKLTVGKILENMSDTGAYIPSRTSEVKWRTRIKGKLEGYLDELQKNGILSDWCYYINKKKVYPEDLGKYKREEWENLTIKYKFNDDNKQIKERVDKSKAKAKRKKDSKQKSIERNKAKAKQKANDQV